MRAALLTAIAGAVLALAPTAATAGAAIQSGHSCRAHNSEYWIAADLKFDDQGIYNVDDLARWVDCPVALDGESSSGVSRDVTWARVSVLDANTGSYNYCRLQAATTGGGKYYSVNRTTGTSFTGKSTMEWSNPLNGGSPIGKLESLSFSCMLPGAAPSVSRVYGSAVGVAATTLDSGPPSIQASGSHCIGYTRNVDDQTKYGILGAETWANTNELSCPLSLRGDSTLGSSRDVAWAWVVLDDSSPTNSMTCDLQLRSSNGSTYYSSTKGTGTSFTGTKKLSWTNPVNGGSSVSAPAVMNFRCVLPPGNVYYEPKRTGVHGYAIGLDGSVGGIVYSL